MSLQLKPVGNLATACALGLADREAAILSGFQRLTGQEFHPSQCVKSATATRGV